MNKEVEKLLKTFALIIAYSVWALVISKILDVSYFDTITTVMLAVICSDIVERSV